MSWTKCAGNQLVTSTFWKSSSNELITNSFPKFQLISISLKTENSALRPISYSFPPISIHIRLIRNPKSDSDFDDDSFPIQNRTLMTNATHSQIILNRKSLSECHCDSFAIQNHTAKSHSDDDFESFPTNRQSNVAFWDRFRFMPNPKSHSKTCFPCQNIEKSWIALPNPTILTISPIFRFWVDFQIWTHFRLWRFRVFLQNRNRTTFINHTHDPPPRFWDETCGCSVR